ncbi:MAG: signal peptidase II, partial [Chloroflexi bacterium]|nr:signal peptidase II [Chloroflexota bacterium]
MVRRTDINKIKLKSLILFISVSIVLVSLYQLTKFLIRTYVPLFTSIPDRGWLRLTHVNNDGGVFGLFPGHVSIFSIMTIIGIIVILVFYYFYA